jgi:hypothetical protein
MMALCARGGFKLKMSWKNKELDRLEVLSKAGQTCRINTRVLLKVTSGGMPVKVKKHKDGSLEFETLKNTMYLLEVE